MNFKNLIIALFLLIMVTSSHAQVANKKSLTLEGAMKVIAAAVDYAKKNNAPGAAIAVVDDGGNLI
ncbi:MAG TPA: heme-binding protein, partial [Thermodesulfobacteriota bacterium]|nr:heme-binding protein [Thermodesulfobacteriota bacterium]